MKPTKHEPCLYRGVISGKEIFLMRQVDDFAVSADDLVTANAVLSIIDDRLTEPMKFQGIISYFNGVTLTQSKHFVKISCKAYLERVFERHGWTHLANKSSRKDVPMAAASKYLLELETTLGPELPSEQFTLQKEMGFSYRAAIGELIYALVTCRPDISFPIIKLSQYSHRPAKCHYHAVKNVF